MSDNILDKIKNLEKKYVTIGIHGDKGEQKKIVRLHPHDKKLPKGTKRETVNPSLTVAQVAQWNEFGAGKIPARSFLRSTFKKRRREIHNLAQQTLTTRPDIFYEVIGQYILNEIKKSINEGIPPPNSPVTIARKGSSKPLVDTGQLRNALTFKVSSYD